MASGRVALVGSLRLLGHASLVIRTLGERRWRRAALLGALSVGGDVRLVRRLRDPRYMPGVGQVLADCVDAAAWSRWGPSSAATLSRALFATAAPSAVLAGYRAAAGVVALPVYDPARPWPPDGSGKARRVAAAAAPVAAAVVSALAVRFDRQRPTAAQVVAAAAPGLAGLSLSIAGARHRESLQLQSRRSWRQRAEEQIHRERVASASHLATSSTPGHDFKKTLLALGLYGDEDARRAALAQGARPAAVLADLPGTTLRDVAGSIPIEPPAAQRFWLDRSDAAAVGAFLDEATSFGVDGTRQVIAVEQLSLTEARLSYLGTSLLLRSEPPPLLARFHPTSSYLLISAFWKASGLIPAWRGLPPALTLPGAAADLVAARRFWKRAPADAELALIHRSCAVQTFLAIALSATRVCPAYTTDGDPVLAGSAYLMGLSLLTVSHWSRLTVAQRSLLPLAYLGWIVAAQLRRPVAVAHVAAELVTILTASLPAWRLLERVESEASLVEDHLTGEFDRACDAGRLDAAAREMGEFRRQLDVARAALARLDGELGHDAAMEITAECDALERWLDATDSAALVDALRSI